MTLRLRNLIAVLALVLGWPRIAWAGMPSIEFTDIARMRLQTISFFLVGLLVSAWVILRIWNSLQKDFPRLPRLTYLKAFGIVVLWGLLFIVVLTMISGARELMTPGAWQKEGATYKLKTPPAPPPLVANEEVKLFRRREKLTKLYEQLRKYAAEHIGPYPDNDHLTEIADSFWQIDDPVGSRYVYVPGQYKTTKASPLAYEPQVVDDYPLVLMTDGVIERMPFNEVLRRRTKENQP